MLDSTAVIARVHFQPVMVRGGEGLAWVIVLFSSTGVESLGSCEEEEGASCGVGEDMAKSGELWWIFILFRGRK